MPRRASQQTSLTGLILVVVLIALGLGGGYFLVSYLTDSYRTLEPLDVSSYYENANSLRGNVYKVEGQIRNQLRWSREAGRLMAIEVDRPTGVAPLAILVPFQFNPINLQRGQNFIFKVEVAEGGVLTVQDMEKR